MYPLSVPYKAFPPGESTGWSSSLEMCREIFRDLEIPWVQDFVLRSPPRQDAYAFTDPDNIPRAMSSCFQRSALPGVSGTLGVGLEIARLIIPVVSIDHIGVSIGVQKNATQVPGTQDVVTPPPGHHFLRCVNNNLNHSQLTVLDYEKFGTVFTPFLMHRKDGLWFAVLPTFDRSAFFSAFDKKSKKVDFEKIDQFLIHSVVLFVKHNCMPTILVNHLHPNQVADNIGHHVMESVITSHANGQPMMSFRLKGSASWSFNYHSSAMRQMLKWGITERIQKIRLAPGHGELINSDCLIANALNDLSEQTASSRESGNSNNVVPYASYHHREETANFVNIAPQPTPRDEGNGNEPGTLERGNDDRSKLELRKIRKRESAARSYRRKVAAKSRSET